MKNLLIVSILFVLGFVSSCKKDETVTPAKPKKEIIVSKTWIVNDVVVSGATVYTKGGTDLANVGFAKVVLNFKSDGSITGSDNSGKALPSSAKWTLSTDETKLNLTNTGVPGLDGDLSIVQLIETNFELKGKIVIPQLGTTPNDVNVKFIPQ
jgi:hypothetical protein